MLFLRKKTYKMKFSAVGNFVVNSKQELHGPPMLVDKTNFGSVLYNHANFYRFEEISSYWSVMRRSGFLCFSLVNQRYTSAITVYNRIVTNFENTVRAVHSSNSWSKLVVLTDLDPLYSYLVSLSVSGQNIQVQTTHIRVCNINIVFR